MGEYFMKYDMEKLTAKLRGAVSAVGYEIWGCEFLSDRGKGILRVYIDSENGVDVEACRKVDQHVSKVLDVENLILSPYTLEVSSPGVERRLFTLEQCSKNEGKEVKVRLRKLKEGEQRAFSGLLHGVDTENSVLTLSLGEDKRDFKWNEIEKINLVFDWN